MAAFLLDKGQKKARAKHYDEAEELFRRAIEEFPPNPEASFAHGQVLEKLDRTLAAATAYQACIAAVSGAKAPSSKLKTVSGRAGRALKKLRRQFAPMNSVNRMYVRKFFEFGKRNVKTNPRWARRAFETVLAIDPTHLAAKSYLEKLPDGPAATKGDKRGGSKGKSWGKRLIRPDTLKGWDPGDTDEWDIDGGLITGDSVGRSGHINWLERVALSGRYTLRLRFKLVRHAGSRRTAGVFIGDGKDWWAIMVDWDDTLGLIRHEAGKNTVVSSREIKDNDWTKWHTLRIEIRKDDGEVFLDDKSMMKLEIPRNQPYAGMVALYVQDAKVQFRDLELRK